MFTLSSTSRTAHIPKTPLLTRSTQTIAAKQKQRHQRRRHQPISAPLPTNPFRSRRPPEDWWAFHGHKHRKEPRGWHDAADDGAAEPRRTVEELRLLSVARRLKESGVRGVREPGRELEDMSAEEVMEYIKEARMVTGPVDLTKLPTKAERSLPAPPALVEHALRQAAHYLLKPKLDPLLATRGQVSDLFIELARLRPVLDPEPHPSVIPSERHFRPREVQLRLARKLGILGMDYGSAEEWTRGELDDAITSVLRLQWRARKEKEKQKTSNTNKVHEVNTVVSPPKMDSTVSWEKYEPDAFEAGHELNLREFKHPPTEPRVRPEDRNKPGTVFQLYHARSHGLLPANPAKALKLTRGELDDMLVKAARENLAVKRGRLRWEGQDAVPPRDGAGARRRGGSEAGWDGQEDKTTSDQRGRRDPAEDDFFPGI